MSASVVALLGFAGWTVLLVFVVLLQRTAVVMFKRTPANSWPRGTTNSDDPPIIIRIRDAHLNCTENLPIFAAIVAAAAALGKLPATDAVALWVLYARLAQSVTHLIGVTHWLVFARASFFSVQLLLYGWMIWRLLA
jgi:uncharacterized MAPEG superfamily protein